MQRSIDWDDLRLVLAIGRVGNLAGAGQKLGLNHTTLYRRLNRLEADLGARLFARAREGYVPTAAGEEALALAARVEDDIAALEQRLRGRDLRPSGMLRVTTADTLAEAVMPNLLAGFRAAHPEITVELVVGGAFFNLTKRDADVAIRPAAELPPHLVGREIACIRNAVYASAAYLARQGEAPALAGQDWVGFDDSLAHLAAARWLAAHIPPERVALKANTLIAVRDAVRAGMGLGILPCFLGDAAPDLRRVQPPFPEPASGLWLVTHPDLHRLGRVRAFMAFAGERLAALRPAFEGRVSQA